MCFANIPLLHIQIISNTNFPVSIKLVSPIAIADRTQQDFPTHYAHSQTPQEVFIQWLSQQGTQAVEDVRLLEEEGRQEGDGARP